jgi:hypothetical protein
MVTADFNQGSELTPDVHGSPKLPDQRVDQGGAHTAHLIDLQAIRQSDTIVGHAKPDGILFFRHQFNHELALPALGKSMFDRIGW